jgi:GTP-binding protein Era
LLVINKIDRAKEESIVSTKTHWSNLLPNAETVEISALTGHYINMLLEKIITLLPESPPFFPKDELTDRPLRFFISEIIREKILLLYKKEIPYSIEVVVESFKETEDLVRIGVMLYCERESQKGIIIGNKGVAIKQLGIEARAAIEDFLEKHVFLDISVKALKDWRNQDLLMKRFGYFQS